MYLQLRNNIEEIVVHDNDELVLIIPNLSSMDKTYFYITDECKKFIEVNLEDKNYEFIININDATISIYTNWNKFKEILGL